MDAVSYVEQHKKLTSPRQVGYVAYVYDRVWYVGAILEVNQEENDIRTSSLHPNGPAKAFTFPKRPDVFWVLLCNIIEKVDMATASLRQYTLEQSPQQSVSEKVISRWYYSSKCDIMSVNFLCTIGQLGVWNSLFLLQKWNPWIFIYKTCLLYDIFRAHFVYKPRNKVPITQVSWGPSWICTADAAVYGKRIFIQLCYYL